MSNTPPILSPHDITHIVGDLTHNGPAIAHPEMLTDAGEMVDAVVGPVVARAAFSPWKRAVGFWLVECGVRVLRDNGAGAEVMAKLGARWFS